MENLSIQETASVDDSELIKWGLHLSEIYVDSLKFYKGKKKFTTFQHKKIIFVLCFRKIWKSNPS